jgi:hypothetical protein
MSIGYFEYCRIVKIEDPAAGTGESHTPPRHLNESVTSAVHVWYNGASRGHSKTHKEAT